MDDATKAKITDSLEEMIIELAPDANLRPMYGGTVVELETDNPKSRIGGFYVYADYVSFEFANGVQFEDLDGVLEGTGKLRRHVKLRSTADVKTKTCKGFLDQAIALAQTS
ncbi:DUF1801 domain-containing protein [Rhodovulum sp. FJ3]|uniref:DUF1801 domain-containing protein n=1 Tax=Rhodovulum sp. FJ3 TaxID=3079053 RepID=UPI00293DC18C|nr:DUF1801 domain-containing protein [Rhodovulum sp. FJ3]MDV4169671.1 DUF1801 domain-containing protein [Rhodovulum sp. FJ3]